MLAPHHRVRIGALALAVTLLLGVGTAAATGFPGAPSKQDDDYGVATQFCSVAPSNRYLPSRVGCVSVSEADIEGDSRPDLIILYSTLTNRRATSDYAPGTAPPEVAHMYIAHAAYLRVIRAGGGVLTTSIPDTRAAWLDAAVHVGADPGKELFIRVSQGSSGVEDVAYGFHAGRLVPAGVVLGSGGDSATKAGFDCLAGDPPRVLTRSFELTGATMTGAWTETDTTYAWHGPRLVRIAKRTFSRHGIPPRSQTEAGGSCARA